MTHEIVNLLLVVFFAAIVQATTGFGFGLIVVGLLSLTSSIKSAAVLNVLPALLINIILIWQLRRHLHWDDLRRIAIATACMTPVGVLALTSLDATLLNGLLAVVLLITVIQSTCQRTSHRPWHPTGLGIPTGMLAGLLAGAYGTGGPPLVAYVQSHRYKKHQHVVSLQLLLGIAGLIRVIAMLCQNTLTHWQWTLNGMSALVVIPGTYLGIACLKHIPEKWLRHMVLIMLVLILIRTLLKVFI